MKRFVLKHINNYLLNHNIIMHCQSAFTKGIQLSTNWLILLIISERLWVTENNFELFFSKAFDKVWHSGILHKLKNYGLGGNIIIWLEHYLQDRFQRVAINGCYSSWQYMHAGVPQRSILASSRFIIHE